MLKFTHLTNNKYTVYMNMFVNPINWLPSLKRRLKIHTNQHSFWLIIIYDNKMPTYKNILKIKVTKLKHKQIQRTSWQHSYICSINILKTISDSARLMIQHWCFTIPFSHLTKQFNPNYARSLKLMPWFCENPQPSPNLHPGTLHYNIINCFHG